MKLFSIILFLIFYLETSGQTKYFSPITQFSPNLISTTFEDIDRNIYIDSKEVLIMTKTPSGRDIQSLIVESIEQLADGIVYHCKSKDRKFPTWVWIPTQQKVEIIDVFQPSLPNAESKHIRFHID